MVTIALPNSSSALRFFHRGKYLFNYDDERTATVYETATMKAICDYDFAGVKLKFMEDDVDDSIIWGGTNSRRFRIEFRGGELSVHDMGVSNSAFHPASRYDVCDGKITDVMTGASIKITSLAEWMIYTFDAEKEFVLGRYATFTTDARLVVLDLVVPEVVYSVFDERLDNVFGHGKEMTIFASTDIFVASERVTLANAVGDSSLIKGDSTLVVCASLGSHALLNPRTGTEIQRFDVPETATNLYIMPDHRFALVLDRTHKQLTAVPLLCELHVLLPIILRDDRWRRFFDADGDHALASVILNFWY